MTLLYVGFVVGAVCLASFLLGRASQRHEHKPRWDELVRLRRKVAALRSKLAERDRTIATLVDQRNAVMESYRRLRDRESA